MTVHRESQEMLFDVLAHVATVPNKTVGFQSSEFNFGDPSKVQ